MTENVGNLDSGADALYPDEPEGGWVSTPVELHDSEILSITLCRFSGLPPMADNTCSARSLGGHPDVECLAVFIRADQAGVGEVEGHGAVTVSGAGTDPTFSA